jgi:hypothetical protein
VGRLATGSSQASSSVARVSGEQATASQARGARPRRSLDRKTILAALAILTLIVAPVLIWAATSGGSDNELRIDQGVSLVGQPEIVVNVPKNLNTPAETNNSSNVKLICVDASGDPVLSTDQDWPFIDEPGYPWPHIHQPVTPQQLQRIAKCRIDGTKTKLQGNLRRT